MNISVLNREGVESYRCDERHIVIAVHDPYGAAPQLPENSQRIGTLFLKFHDWDDKQKIILESSQTRTGEPTKAVFFNEEDAQKIAEFVYENIVLANRIICACEAGISRSAGIAAALSKALGGDDEYFFKRYIPNSRVYRLTLNAWIKLTEGKKEA